MEWIAYCSECGELERAPNGPMMESVARLHRRDTGHMTIIGYEPSKISAEEEAPSGLPFPKTYGDWSELAGKMKDKTSHLVTRTSINYQLDKIYEGGPEAEEAKRWMVKTAGDLGVK